MNLPPVIYFIIFAFLLILAILWFLLPFAIFGTKDLLEKILKSNEETNAKLEKLIQNKEI
jgi:hypothetical protein